MNGELSAGYPINGTNPVYTRAEFKLLIPELAKFIDGESGTLAYDIYFAKANDLVNIDQFYGDWLDAITYFIAHHIQLLNMRREGSYSLNEVANQGVGGLPSTEVYNYSMNDKDSSLFWNQTKYGKLYNGLAEIHSTAQFIIAI